VPVPNRAGLSDAEAGETVIPRAQLIARPPRSAVRDLNLEQQDIQEGPRPPQGPPVTHARNTSLQSLNSLPNRIYDNSSFEDAESDLSREWNPLFSSSPQAARQEELRENVDNEDHSQEFSEPMSSPLCDLFASCHQNSLLNLMKKADTNSDALMFLSPEEGLRRSRSSTTFLLDIRKWQQKQKYDKQQRQGHELRIMDTLTDEARMPVDFSRNKAVEAFVSRMVCCLSTPTRGSSFGGTLK
jgi:hypothetical protein